MNNLTQLKQEFQNSDYFSCPFYDSIIEAFQDFMDDRNGVKVIDPELEAELDYAFYQLDYQQWLKYG